MNPLQPLSMPLTGSALIEASAGTGKTFTLTTLFLRLLLERKVAVDQILVVTFTIAATEELRLKIHQRLSLAHKWVRDDMVEQMAGAGVDDTLAELLGAHPAQSSAVILADAVARMDQAAVYTIDAFCLRVLQDRAFDTGLPFRIDFIADDMAIRELVVRDYWRRAGVDPGGMLARALRNEFTGPDALLGTLTPILRLAEPVIIPEVDEIQLAALRERLQQQWIQIQDQWQADSNQIAEIVLNSPAIGRNRYRNATCAELIRYMGELDGTREIPEALHKKFELFERSFMAGAIKKNHQLPEHPFFDCCDQFSEQHQSLHRQLGVAVRLHACSYLRRGIRQYKQARALMHFEDLRSNLDEALRGSNGASLASRIQQVWPFAMIDEFQDTDPQQYRMFSSVFAGNPDGGLYLIGDPKQAIYSFRGADIFTYMGASREADPSRSYTLGVNWRSDGRLVSAVNAIFQFRPQPFIYDCDIPFNPVAARPGADDSPLTIAGETPAPLQFQVLQPDQMPELDKDGRVTSGEAKRAVAAACASSIATLLNAGDAGEANIAGKAVQAADIAVLVRSHADGTLIRKELRKVGVRAVSVTNATVFQSDEAIELATVLRAIDDSSHLGLVRAALVTRLLGYTATELDQLDSDERYWDELLERFHRFAQVWARRGILAAVQMLFSAMNISNRLLQYPDGEQRITNVVQLGELLQIQSQLLATPGDLLAWFDSRLNTESHDDELLLRLESDESLVRIVTVHKSKGLEYPIVYYPFPWPAGKSPSGGMAKFHDPRSLGTVIDLGSESLSENLKLQRTETAAEDLRLAYVALTRARNACIIYWGAIKDAEKSALGRLLHQRPDPETDAVTVPMKSLGHRGIVADLEALAATAPGCISVELLDANARSIREATEGELVLTAQTFDAQIDRRWAITSYTRMIQGIDSGRPDHDTVVESAAIDSLSDKISQAPEIEDPGGEAIFALPAGAVTGQMLHDLLEHMDFPAMDQPSLVTLLENTLQKRAEGARAGSGWSPEHLSAAALMLHNTLQTPLNENSGLRLADVQMADRLNEMEFHFSIVDLDADSLSHVLADEPAYQHTATGLLGGAARMQLSGLMRGFIDMVVRHRGQYYIVDYKSNRLGTTLAYYQQPALQRAIQAHHYDLQYLIYTVALHRYLKTRIPDYQYERDFGGVYYLFLRGIRPGQSSGVWFDRPAAPLIEKLDLAFAGPLK